MGGAAWVRATSALAGADASPRSRGTLDDASSLDVIKSVGGRARGLSESAAATASIGDTPSGCCCTLQLLLVCPVCAQLPHFLVQGACFLAGAAALPRDAASLSCVVVSAALDELALSFVFFAEPFAVGAVCLQRPEGGSECHAHAMWRRKMFWEERVKGFLRVWGACVCACVFV